MSFFTFFKFSRKNKKNSSSDDSKDIEVSELASKESEQNNENVISHSTTAEDGTSQSYEVDKSVQDEKKDVLSRLYMEINKLEVMQDIFQDLYLKTLYKSVYNKKLKGEHVTLYRILSELKYYKNDKKDYIKFYSVLRFMSVYYHSFRHIFVSYRLGEFIKMIFLLFILNLPKGVFIFVIVFYIGYCLTIMFSLNHIFVNYTRLLKRKIRATFNYIKSFFYRRINRQNDSSNSENTSSAGESDVATSFDAPGFGYREDVLHDNAVSESQTIPLIRASSNGNESVNIRDLFELQISADPRIRNIFDQIQQAHPVQMDVVNQFPEPIRRSYLQKFCYQLFVSFFMSLMPWWSPNPEYL